MTLWIVEDDDMQLSLILKEIEKEKEFSKDFKIHVNRDISWPPDETLPTLTPNPGGREAGSPNKLPDIIVLDLLLETNNQEFAGRPFYERLRQEEENAHKRPSQVIVYSQLRGLACTEKFVEACRSDHHFVDLVKSPALLMKELGRARQKVLDSE